MSKQTDQYSKKAGLPPGSIVYVGEERSEEVSISEIDFSPDRYDEKTLDNISKCKAWKNEGSTTWIDVNGVHDTDVIQSVGEHFGLDDLVMEDIVNTNQRPKAEEFEDYLFVSIKALAVDNSANKISIEQVSIILGKNWLISFQEADLDVFNDFKDRIRKAMGNIRERKSDFIFYRLLDTLVDNYFSVTEFLSAEIEKLENRILEKSSEDVHEDIYKLKQTVGTIKKAVVPLRDTVSSIIRSDDVLLSEPVLKYMRDVYDHIIQLIDVVETQRETLNDFLNLYMSGMSNKMNEVMKVLTIFASIFIPLTFIAGIYGMNFDKMPELHWEYGYLITWAVMVGVAVALLIYFRRKKWL